jgi:hypothetical protein
MIAEVGQRPVTDTQNTHGVSLRNGRSHHHHSTPKPSDQGS